jgi:3-phosphoshikimate 1-carboxyvinyltransferase
MTKDLPKSIVLSHPGGAINGTIHLNRSKSISNRVQIIRSLCSDHFPITNLSDSDDSQLLHNLLTDPSRVVYDAHHAGTTYRFLCSYLAVKPGMQVLTGSSRMKERPVKALADALVELGADITYLGAVGYPPIRIGNPSGEWKKEVTLPADISSQYISSLMMVAPTLPHGLKIHLEGQLVSRPYLDMTMRIMQYFGADVSWENQVIQVKARPYSGRPFDVEADWSAASYYYAIIALSPVGSSLKLIGLYKDSLQGDCKIVEMMISFGVDTTYEDGGITLSKAREAAPFFEYDFIEQPDLAQTIIVLCGGLGISGLFTGLQTLRIKETDRIAALQTELSKYGTFLSAVPPRFAKKSGKEYFMVEGKASENIEASIDTYRDHRMAMAFAPMALKFPITINDPAVVSKSYPQFWEDLKKIGFKVQP